MKRIALSVFAVCVATAAIAGVPATAPELTAAQIIEKNIAARGGLDSWRKIQTMVWVGHIESANAPAAKMPFSLEQKRPNKTRFEIKAQNQLALRIFDGTNGWKLRPSASGKPEVQPFSNEELGFAHDGQGIDGPLVDYAAKGVAIALEGVDDVEGHKAYRLNVRLPSGLSHQLWIDAQNFLDIKSGRQIRNTLGQTATVSVYYRNYQTVEGVKLPFSIETSAETKAPDRMVIDKVALNVPLEDQMFSKPQVQAPGRRNGVTVDTRSPPPQANPTAWMAPSTGQARAKGRPVSPGDAR